MHLYKPVVVMFILAMIFIATKSNGAQQLIPQSYIKYLPLPTGISLLVKSPGDSEPLIAHDTKSYKPPASTLKLATGLAAKLYMDDNFAYSTTLEMVGHDLVIRFTGDAQLTDKDITALLMDYKKHFGTKIRGDILLDGSIFNGQEWPQGVSWNDLSACFSAPSTAMSLNHNCVYAKLNSQLPVGKVASVQLPSDTTLIATSDARIIPDSEDDNLACSLDASLAPFNQYFISGCVRQTERPLPLRFAVQNTETYVKTSLQQLLKKAKMQFKGKIRVTEVKPGRVISQHLSAPMSSLLQTMLLNSDNLIADNLTKMLGHLYFQQPGNYKNGTRAIVAILKEKAGIDISSAYLADGSGLSSNNRLTAHQIMQILEYMYKNDKTLGLLSMLPISATSGTLKNYKSLNTDKLKGRIKAKTGKIFSTHNLVGVVETVRGKPLLFVQMVTGYMPLEERAPNVSASSGTRIERFEKALYTDLVNWK